MILPHDIDDDFLNECGPDAGSIREDMEGRTLAVFSASVSQQQLIRQNLKHNQMFLNKYHYDLWIFLIIIILTMTESFWDCNGKNFFHKYNEF